MEHILYKYNVYGKVALFLHAFDGELSTVITSPMVKEAS